MQEHACTDVPRPELAWGSWNGTFVYSDLSSSVLVCECEPQEDAGGTWRNEESM